MKPSLALFASAALILGGCASQETTLETEQAYQVDWVGHNRRWTTATSA